MAGNVQLRDRKFFTKSRKASYRHLVLISCFQIPTTIYNRSDRISGTVSDDPSPKKENIYILPEEGQVQCWQGLISSLLTFLNDKSCFLKWMLMILIIKTKF